MPFQRIPDTVDVNAKIAAYDGPINGLYTVGNPAAAHAEIGTNGAGQSGIRLYAADGVTVLIDLDALTGDGTFQGDITGSNITGSTLTGGVVQTAASGQRAVLDGGSNSLEFYDAAGNPAGGLFGNGGITEFTGLTKFDNGILVTAGGANITGTISGNLFGNVTGSVVGGTLTGTTVTATAGDMVAAGSVRSGNAAAGTSGDVIAALTCQLLNPPTTSTAANAWINTSTGRINKSTSSRRFKTRIRRLRDGARVLALRPVSFQDKAEAKADPGSRRYWGLIAEEVAQVLPEVVSYDAKGRPESVMYDRVVVGLLDVVRDLTARLDRVEATSCA
jgi:hypothetical protein